MAQEGRQQLQFERYKTNMLLLHWLFSLLTSTVDITFYQIALVLSFTMW